MWHGSVIPKDKNINLRYNYKASREDVATAVNNFVRQHLLWAKQFEHGQNHDGRETTHIMNSDPGSRR